MTAKGKCVVGLGVAVPVLALTAVGLRRLARMSNTQVHRVVVPSAEQGR